MSKSHSIFSGLSAQPALSYPWTTKIASEDIQIGLLDKTKKY